MRVIIGGASGWAGSALAHAVVESKDLELIAGVSRSFNGRTFDDVGTGSTCKAPLFGKLSDALACKADVYVEYTSSSVAKQHILEALEADCHVVIGTSGLGEADFQEITAMLAHSDKAVLAVGNFALTAVLLQHCAELVASYIPDREIIDYAKAAKKDAPSGTARELAARLERVASEAPLSVALEDVAGIATCRGGRVHGTQIHSVRSPAFTLGIDVVFGMQDQRLTISHEAGSSALPYVDGGLLAIRKVHTLQGFHQGLQSVMNF